MFCMNKFHDKVVLMMVFICFLATPTFAQTYYYKLTKKIVNGMPIYNMAGGQFVTFSGSTCYDTDKKGNPVGNGTLKYKPELSSDLYVY